jgi:hypothetical protein
MQNAIIEVLVALLVPIVPAFTLYKFLPSKATVRGPFKGFAINLSGAFAGYFLLVITTLEFLHVVPLPILQKQDYVVWTVKGNVHLEQNTAGHTASGITYVWSPYEEINDDGSFSLHVAVPEKPSGHGDFPVLILDRLGYCTEYVHLDSVEKSEQGLERHSLVYDDTLYQIKIRDAVLLRHRPGPAYADAGEKALLKP